MVNIIIAVILFFIVPVNQLLNQNLSENLETLKIFNLQNFLLYLLIVNIGLVIFNLIPAFPMDGGRILRAALSLKLNRVKATQIASNIGQFIAVLFLLIGLVYNPFLIFIALFIFLGAFSENKMVHDLAILDGHTVEDAMILNITTFSPDDSIDLVVNKIISGTETNFLVVKDHVVIGILYHQDIIDNSNKNVFVKEVMKTDFITVKSTDDLKKIYNLIYLQKKTFIPVVDDNKILGVIDLSNLNEYIMLQSKLAY